MERAERWASLSGCVSLPRTAAAVFFLLVPTTLSFLPTILAWRTMGNMRVVLVCRPRPDPLGGVTHFDSLVSNETPRSGHYCATTAWTRAVLQRPRPPSFEERGREHPKRGRSSTYEKSYPSIASINRVLRDTHNVDQPCRSIPPSGSMMHRADAGSKEAAAADVRSCTTGSTGRSSATRRRCGIESSTPAAPPRGSTHRRAAPSHQRTGARHHHSGARVRWTRPSPLPPYQCHATANHTQAMRHSIWWRNLSVCAADSLANASCARANGEEILAPDARSRHRVSRIIDGAATCSRSAGGEENGRPAGPVATPFDRRGFPIPRSQEARTPEFTLTLTS